MEQCIRSKLDIVKHTEPTTTQGELTIKGNVEKDRKIDISDSCTEKCNEVKKQMQFYHKMFI
jgi:hypothetical protein